MSRPASRASPPAFGPTRMMLGGRPPVKSLHFKATARRLLGTLRPERAVLSLVVVSGAASVALSVLGPWLLGRATDIVFRGVTGARGVDFAALGRVLLWVLVAYVLAASFGMAQARLIAVLVSRTVFRMREQVEAKLFRLPLRYVDQQPRGELLSRATNDIDNVAQTLQQTLSLLLTALLTVIGVLAMMFWISPLLAGVVLVTVPLSVAVSVLVGRRAQPRFAAQWASTGRLNGHVEEMFTGHSLVKAFGRQPEAAATFDRHNTGLHDASFRAQFLAGVIEPAMMFIANVNYVAVAVVGGLRVASGAMSLGAVQAFIQYSPQFSQPLTQVASMAGLVQSGVASAERVFALLDAGEQAPDPVSPARPPLVRGRVAFEDVSFRYSAEQPLIEHLSLSVEPGQTVAVVGPTGAGKTTLVSLLMRFYEVSSGRITLDGVDIATMSRADLRRHIGLVLQDTWLFGGTIEENIGYGAERPTRERVDAAARVVHADRFVRTLPAGYQTLVDDEGGGVSAGERQLITIARAFLAEPSILVLDEATSSVDTRTEVLVRRAMGALRAGRTCFVIAHRLSTVRDADVILVLDAGRIVEQGRHADLLAAGGAYARLHAAQFAEPVVGAG